MENLANKFIVVAGDDAYNNKQTLYLISAKDEKEALTKYAEHIAVTDDDFLYYAYSVSMDEGVAGHFWVMGDEGNGSMEFSKDEVIEFFGENKDFAKSYIKFYTSYLEAFDKDEEEFEYEDFSKEMLAYIFINSNWSYVRAFDLKKLKTIN